jgi:hypothetical protein
VGRAQAPATETGVGAMSFSSRDMALIGQDGPGPLSP